MANIKVPFLFVNPKSYLWGNESLELALKIDRICEEKNIMIFYTCPYADIQSIAHQTKHIIVTAQNVDSIKPGRGMGLVLLESLADAGAKAVVINHAENPKSLAEINECIERVRKIGLVSIVCADSILEAKAVAVLNPDIILAEQTSLIGTGTTADDSYTIDSCREIKEINPSVKVMIASGITTGEDCYNVIVNGADGTGSTSGIIQAIPREKRVEEMVNAIMNGMRDRK